MRASEIVIVNNFVIKGLERISPLHHQITEAISEEAKHSKSDLKEIAKLFLNKMEKDEPSWFNKFHYHNSVLRHTSNMISSIKRIEMIPIFIRRFHRSKAIDDCGFGLHDWIQYHYSFYTVLVIGIYDTALLLTNSVFNLCIKPEACNERTVARNDLVMKTLVHSALRSLEDKKSEYRVSRNHFTHRNIVPELADLDTLEISIFLDEMGRELMLDDDPSLHDPFFHPVNTELRYRKERALLVKRITQEVISLASSVSDVFSSLLPVYDAVSNLLEEKAE